MGLLPHPVRAAVVIALGCLAGCRGQDPSSGRPPVYPVEGQLFVSGIPAAHAQIAFHPLTGDGPGAVLPVGRTGPDGSFRLMTYSPGDGAPAGEYAVSLIWPNDSLPIDECAPTAHDRLNGYYADPSRRRVLATVRPGPNSIILRVEVGTSGWSLPKRQDVGGKR